jgi:hypothetical protein
MWFPIDLSGNRPVPRNGISVADQAAGKLGKDKRCFRDLPLAFFGMVLVVETQGNDFGWSRHRGRKPDPGNRDRCLPLISVRIAIRNYIDHVSPHVEGSDPVALYNAGPDPVVMVKPGNLHGETLWLMVTRCWLRVTGCGVLGFSDI